jgi:ABC-type uncharacterized transport system substrate-binding protein
MQFDQFRRREFISLLGGAAAWPLAARAQQAKRYRIGMLETVSPALNAAQLDAFRSGLRELGYVDGYANRFPELAAELVRLGVDLIVVRGTPAEIAAKNATGTIPIVMASVGEPLLVVDSLARPGRSLFRSRPKASMFNSGETVMMAIATVVIQTSLSESARAVSPLARDNAVAW